MLVFSVAIFTSAFLVFQVQPIIARYILPWFGGTPSVWTACMLFYQLGLLLGYTYAHLLARRLGIRQQLMVHGCLLLVSLIFLPIVPNYTGSSSTSLPLLQIFLILTVSVGLPFILLSASAPLLQHWFANRYPGVSPFRLYALSNVGSLLALLSYPLLVEPALTLSLQSWLWSGFYVVYIALLFACAWLLYRYVNTPSNVSTSLEAEKISDDYSVVSVIDRMMWLLFSALGVIVLLSVTNQITQDVAVVPFFWILPLSLYLITFIICFERDGWYQRPIWMPFMVLSVGMLTCLIVFFYDMSLLRQMIIFGAVVFSCCMVCHGELVRLRPKASQLTEFYLYVALGGSIGGIFVNLIAPLIFNGYWELYFVLIAICALSLYLVVFDGDPVSKHQTNAFILYGCLGLLVLTFLLTKDINEGNLGRVMSERNFFGVIAVEEENINNDYHMRFLRHGVTTHGAQWMNPNKKQEATTYFGPNSGVGLAITQLREIKKQSDQDATLRVGTIGLGVGTLASYGRPADLFRFYEIDPAMKKVASRYFTFLDESQAEIDIVMGDGRLSLKHELDTVGSRAYDILVLDAFSSDAIPAHLLTREAANLYWRHLRDDGILALHITNIYVDLSDVVRQLARYSKKSVIHINNTDFDGVSSWGTNWVLITNNDEFLNDNVIVNAKEEWLRKQPKDIIWTDDYSNLFDTIRW